MALKSLRLKTEYRTGVDDLILDFYAPCTSASMHYDRAVGYFRSSILLLAGGALVDLALRRGQIRLVCSPDLSAEDIDAIRQGYEQREQILSSSLICEISTLLEDAATKEQATVLATLIATGSMDVKVAVRPSGYGLFHEKLGIFEDSVADRVSFRGSSNETWSGWHWTGNHEAFEVFRSWASDDEASRVKRHSCYFDDLWSGRVKDVDCLPLPRLAKEYLEGAAHRSLDALLSTGPSHTIAPRRPMKHQLDALDDWNSKSQRGILKHATGSGKTYTAICALRNRPALVVVPSQLLVSQWTGEVRRELPDVAILTVGAGSLGWRAPGRVESFTTAEHELGKRLIIATLQTACKDEFLSRVKQGSHLMVVCDEVHHAGSSIDSGARLGLSATPERYGDPDGTAKILSYFQGILKPEFTLEDAIKAGRLVPYEYYPHSVALRPEEEDQWGALSERIVREVAMLGSTLDERIALPDSVKYLLIKRARIAKKAANKTSLVCDIVARNYEQGQRWLIYCEDTEQLDLVATALRNQGFDPMEFHSTMDGAPSDTLLWFKRFGGLLVSIRCLDEGVDIPETSHAIILASSKNPREFIQRRGRVLRTAPGKYLAVVHDALVVPSTLLPEGDILNLVKAELARAVEFSKSSINRSAQSELLTLAVGLGVAPESFISIGLEDDEHQ
jgi:superfamily II DNA or RNA helicase